jgi:GT2 family glycosyltransferase
VALSGISVVVPTRDTRDVTLRCLASVTAASRGVPADVVLVDDGSRDGTADEVAARFPQARIIRHDTSLGFTASANAGLRMASGALLLLLNSDTELETGALDALVAAFDRDPRLGIAGGQLLYPDGSPQWSGGAAPTLAWLFAEASGAARALGRVPGYRSVRPLAPNTDRDVDWVTGAAMAIRREVWTDVGPLDEAFRIYAQDLDFCVRARDRGWGVRIVSACRVRHHHGATITRVLGRVGHQHPQSLWTDLVRWAEKRHGAAYARRAGWAIASGARLRLVGRGLVSPAVPVAQREGWQGETRELRLALAALRGAGHGGHG